MPNDFVERILLSQFETAKERKKIIARARKTGVTRVMLFDTYGHIEAGHFDLDVTRKRAGIIQKATRDFKAAGLGVGINVHVTIGMNMSPPRSEPLPFEHNVDFDGQVFPETYCPIDPGFQAFTAETYAILAAVEGIDDIWIDDDYRYKTKAAQCFCDIHLAEFAKITGRPWTRDEVVAALESPTPIPTEIGVQWSKLQNRAMIDCARALADAVHNVAPDLRIGFMPPSLNLIFYGGASIAEMAEVLNPASTNPGPSLIRPEYGSYNDLDRLGWSAYAPTWSAHRGYGDSAAFEGWPEIETWPSTGYNHSARVMQMKLGWGAVHGYISTTISSGRLDKPALKAIANAKKQIVEITPFVTSSEWQTRGVSVELSENIVGLRPRAGDTMNLNLEESRIMSRFGIPLWPGGDNGRVVMGNAPLARKDELDEFARDGMVVDRDAFEMLQHMGRDDILGGARLLPMPAFPASEQFMDSSVNGEARGRHVALDSFSVVRHDFPIFDLPESDEFTPLCQFLDQDENPFGVSAWTREWSGGRIAVVPFRLGQASAERGLLAPLRKTQLEAMLEWTSGKQLPVRFGFDSAYDLKVVYRQHTSGKRVFLGFGNFSLDDLTDVTLHLPLFAEAKTVEIRMLDDQGKWKSTESAIGEGGCLKLRGRFGIPDQEIRVYEIIATG
jgi:hypothetical protein